MYVTERREHLQIPNRVPGGGWLKQFRYGGGTFAIVRESTHRDLVPPTVHPWFEVKQYEAREAGTGEAVEVYVYYYEPVGHPYDMAIVDAIRPMDGNGWDGAGGVARAGG